MICDDCRTRKRWGLLKGDGYCDIHDLRFFFDRREQICPKCAKENNLCAKCGKKFGDELPKLSPSPECPS